MVTVTGERPSVIGIDTGGTFIDLVVCTPDGRLDFHKQLADPADLPGSVLRGLASLANRRHAGLGELLAATDTIVHGTTIATNAVLTRTGTPTALLTTAGLRDTLEMRRGVKEDVFDLHAQAPEPLVPRERRYGVEERIGHDGAVLAPLRMEAAVGQLHRSVQRGETRSVAICLMHAWINPGHERALAARLRGDWPALPVACSSDVLPQIGFYDRLSTTVTTAYTAPLVSAYLETLARRLGEAGFAGRLFVISSAGGLMTADDARTQAARTVLSGPAAAPVAGARLCAGARLADAVVLDMGGTSFDVSLVRGGAPVHAPGGEIGGLRVGFPMTDVRTIALGGGSIAWLDAGGLLRLGPQSAGASPGPACFGRGGTAPTITDADLLLGYLDARHFDTSELRLDRTRAETALRDGIGQAVGGDPVRAAIGVFRLAAARMAEATLRVALDGGLDYRRVPLVVGGGAGPLHAAAIGRELGTEVLIVPGGASTLCAIGALLLRPQYDQVAGLFVRLGALDPRRLQQACDRLVERIAATCRRTPDALDLTFAGDLRYVGQEPTLPAVFDPAEVRAHGVERLRAAFEQLHRLRYGYVLESEEIEVVSLRVTASWDVGAPERMVTEAEAAPGGPPSRREAYDATTGAFREFAVHAWGALRPGDTVAPPSVVEMIGSTCVVTAPYRGTMDAARNLVLTRNGGSALP